MIKNLSNLIRLKNGIGIRNFAKLSLLLLSVSCLRAPAYKANVNTEINCPIYYYRFLMLHATRQEVQQSIMDAIKYRESSNFEEKYTVLKLPDGRSTSIYNITPKELLHNCSLRELPRKSTG